jgi:hypothetical protein
VPDTSDHDQQTAMLLTQQEWEDLGVICALYRVGYRYAVGTDDVDRRIALCERIIEATDA